MMLWLVFFCVLCISSSTAVVVTTEAEFHAAIRANSHIVLGEDLTLESTIQIKNIKNISIDGNGKRINGQSKLTCFSIVGSITTMTVSDTVIENGFNALNQQRGGGVYVADEASVTFMNCVFKAHKATNYPLGGAFYITEKANVLIQGCTFIDNISGNGGAVCLAKGSLIVYRSSFVNNTASRFGGGGIYIIYGDLAVSDSSFTNNTSAGAGGSICVFSGSISVASTVFENNYAVESGGAILFQDSHGRGLITKSTFVANRAAQHGGSICVLAAINFEISNCTYIDNSAASDGGALYISSPKSNLTLSGNVTFFKNAAGNNGGAICNYNAQLEHHDGSTLVFFGNQAGNDGGGLFAYTSESSGWRSLKLYDATFERNVCRQRGGAMMIDTPRAPPLKAMLACDICGYTYEKPCLYIAINETWREFDHTAEVVLHRPIFRFNEAAGAGASGGALAIVNGEVTLIDGKFIGNRASTDGGAVCLPRAQWDESTTKLTLHATYFEGNSATLGKGNELYSQSASSLNFVHGTMFSSTLGGNSDVEIELGGSLLWDETSGIECALGHKLERPTNIPPHPSSPLPGWNNSVCRSETGPCPLALESCWPPMLQQSLAFNCTPCNNGSYSLDRGMLLGERLTEIKCEDSCPYGGDCALGGSDIRAQPNFFGAREEQTSNVRFVPCPAGYCCNGAELCPWDQVCVGNRQGLLCGLCKSGYSASLMSYNCVPDTACNIWWSIYTVEAAKSFSYALMFYYRSSLGFASSFALVAFYVQVFNIVSAGGASRYTSAAASLSFLLGSSSVWGSSKSSGEYCAWPGMQPLNRAMTPFFDVTVVLVVLALVWGFVRVRNEIRGISSNEIKHADSLYSAGRETYAYTNLVMLPEVSQEEHSQRSAAAAAQALNFSVSSVAAAAAASLTCTDALPGSTLRLLLDANVECYTPWQVAIFSVVLAVSAVAVSPLCLAAVLCFPNSYTSRRVRDAIIIPIRQSAILDHVARLASEPFRASCWPWLSVIVLQRLALILLRALAWLNPTSRALWSTSLCTASLLAQVHFRPFKDPFHNFVQSLLLFCTVVVAAINLVFATLATNAINTTIQMDREVGRLLIAEECLLFAPICIVFAVWGSLNFRDLRSAYLTCWESVTSCLAMVHSRLSEFFRQPRRRGSNPQEMLLGITEGSS